MKLEYIQLSNFRCFYGTTPRVEFSTGDRNVTAIIGVNGSGKTALLNAFTWALHDSFTRGFKLKEQLVNKRAIREADVGEVVQAWVEVGFSHDDTRYQIRRTASVARQTGEPGWKAHGEQEVVLRYASTDGEWKQDDRVADVIGRILPKQLYPYFFFDGEQLERIVDQDNKEKRGIENATKIFMGVQILTRAEDHLAAAKKDLEGELERIGDPETASLLHEKAQAEQELIRERDALETIGQNIDGHGRRKGELEEHLRKLAGAKATQEQRDQLRNQREQLDQYRTQAYRKIVGLLSSKAYTVFLPAVFKETADFLEDLRKKRQLPSGIKRQFVDDLLAARTCICGTPLEPGSEAHRHVESYRAKAGMQDVEERGIELRGKLLDLQSAPQSFWKQLDEQQQQRREQKKQIAEIDDKLNELRKKLKDSPEEDIAKLQAQLDAAEQAHEKAVIARATSEAKIRQLDALITKLDSSITRHRAVESKQALAQARVAVAAESIRTLQKVRAGLEADFRTSLQTRIRDLFKKMSYKPYVPALEDDYSLTLLEQAGGTPLPVATSGGESTLLSLSFIASIIGLAKEFQAKRDGLPGPDTSQYPVVMDSPYGQFGEHYRIQTSENLPMIANQVVVMVSETQWRGETEQTLSPKIGARYVLTYFNPDENAEDVTLALGGSEFVLCKKSPDEFEYTLIQEVSHA